MKNKIVKALSTALIIGISSTTFAAANPFNDLDSNHWAYSKVIALVDAGIIEPDSNDRGSFFGNMKASRYDVVKMVYNLHMKKNDVTTSTENPFSDVPAGHPATVAIARLAADGIIKPSIDGKFHGNDKITRYDMAVMIANLLSKDANLSIASTTNMFSDVPDNHPAYNAVMTLTKEEILSGYGDGTFKGDKNVTRFEAALMINKVFEKYYK
ncbi:MAG: S-layer homology domain-containing protein [Selenomonadaceae bacterium]|nr:S-layer homology domain-containing protein [Selenomonadaceae bacterium]MBR1859668.1 S-layer homology domain-containing protein [Selenomonadaceae bacterium]